MRSSIPFQATVLLALAVFQTSALIEPIAAFAQEIDYSDDYPPFRGSSPTPVPESKPAPAPVPSANNTNETIWDHNGSKIAWASNGASRTATYLEPRAGLISAGVSPGTVLFQGERHGNTISGTAYSFKTRCSPAPYKVEATITSEKEFVLEGAAPVFESDGCTVARYDRSHRNASLRFTFIERDAPPAEIATISPASAPTDDDLQLRTETFTWGHEEKKYTISVRLPAAVRDQVDKFQEWEFRSELVDGKIEWTPALDVQQICNSRKDDNYVRSDRGDGWCHITKKRSGGGFGIHKAPGFSFSLYAQISRTIALKFWLDYAAKDEAYVDQFLPATIETLLESTEAARSTSLQAKIEREQEEAAEAERERANKVDPYTMVWRIKSSYQYKAQVAFYSDVRKHAWPDFDNAWDLNDSQIHTFRLACQRGEKICYGAWATGNSSIYWGVGMRNENRCTRCCYTCGSVAGVELIDSGNGNGEARGITAEDLLGAAVGIGLGAAIAGARGGSGGTVRTAPRPAPYTTRSPADLEESTITGRRR